MKILETERTILSEVLPEDAAFVLDLLNQPSFIKYIGDRNVRDIEQAREYIASRFTKSYEQFGFGMWKVESKIDRTPIGLCGFVKRDYLDAPDIGFAFLAAFEGKGFGFETAFAALKFGRNSLGFERVLAITTPDNENSIKLLGKLNFKFENLITAPTGEELNLFSLDTRKNHSF